MHKDEKLKPVLAGAAAINGKGNIAQVKPPSSPQPDDKIPVKKPQGSSTTRAADGQMKRSPSGGFSSMASNVTGHKDDLDVKVVPKMGQANIEGAKTPQRRSTVNHATSGIMTDR